MSYRRVIPLIILTVEFIILVILNSKALHTIRRNKKSRRSQFNDILIQIIFSCHLIFGIFYLMRTILVLSGFEELKIILLTYLGDCSGSAAVIFTVILSADRITVNITAAEPEQSPR